MSYNYIQCWFLKINLLLLWFDLKLNLVGNISFSVNWRVILNKSHDAESDVPSKILKYGKSGKTVWKSVNMQWQKPSETRANGSFTINKKSERTGSPRKRQEWSAISENRQQEIASVSTEDYILHSLHSTRSTHSEKRLRQQYSSVLR